MTIQDPARQRRLEQRLVEMLGEEEAETLIDQLARGEPATKTDLDALEQRLGGRIDGLGRRIDGLEGRIDGLEGRIDRLEGRIDGLEGRIDGLGRSYIELRDMLVERIDARAEALDGRIEGVEGRLTATLHRELGAVRTDMAAQTRTFVLAQLGMLVTLAALAFAALRIT